MEKKTGFYNRFIIKIYTAKVDIVLPIYRVFQCEKSKFQGDKNSDLDYVDQAKCDPSFWRWSSREPQSNKTCVRLL